MRFSIVVPTFNRPEPLNRCLKAIGAMHYPRLDFEVLVIDDGSQPPPDEIIAHHAIALQLRYYRNRGKGPACARNDGLRRAQGDYVVFTDDDCLPHERWLSAFDDIFAQYPDWGLGGAIISAEQEGIFGRTSQLLITFLYNYADTDPAVLPFFCSNNLAFHRSKLVELGGFEEAFPLSAAEDRDICARWLLQGELHFVPDAIVRHYQNLNAFSFLSQHYRYGRGAFQFWSRRQDLGGQGRRLASWRFYSKLFIFPFSTEPFLHSIVMCILFGVSQIACAAGYFAERLRNTR